MTIMLGRFVMDVNFRQGLAKVLGLAAAAVGGGHLVAWLAGVMGQRGLGTITMKTNAALCLFLAGAALVLLASPALHSWSRWFVKVCAGTVVLIAALTLGENVAGWDLGIDQLLATEAPGALGVAGPNRMGVPASTCFILAGTALLILATPRTRARRIVLAQGLALVVCLITLLSTLGFLYEARQLYAVARLTGIAWPTAIAILGLGIGLLFARPSEGLMAQVTASDAGGASIRRLLIPAILLPLGLGWLRLAGERAGLYDAAIGTALVMLTFVVVFASFVYWAGRRTSQSSAALTESEARFRTLADTSPVILWMTDAQGGNQFVNRTYREFFGVSIEEVAGGNWHPLLHPDDVENYLRIFLTAVQKRTSFTAEARVRRADGAWRWITSHADPRFTPSGEFLGHVGISPDITERKQAEEELREINRTLEQRVAERTAEAEQRAEELRALAGELARTERREQRRLAQWLHDDLQQLLVATKMQIAVAQATISEQDFRQLLQKASRLIDESIGRARSMTTELSPPILHESGLVAGLEQLSRWIEEKHELHVTVETRAQIYPENQEAAVVLFGATRELLFNVVKHAGVNEALVTLTEQDGRIELTVEDEGLGFDPALVREGSKSGFGLLNVRERLRSIGGDFRVQTAPGQGTRVTLLAPARPAEAPARPAPAGTQSSQPS